MRDNVILVGGGGSIGWERRCGGGESFKLDDDSERRGGEGSLYERGSWCASQIMTTVVSNIRTRITSAAIHR